MSYRGMSLRISMTLESYDEQHVWREPDIRCSLHRGLLSGQTGLMQMPLLLTQHLLAVAARNIWHRSIFAKAAVQTDQVSRISN